MNLLIVEDEARSAQNLARYIRENFPGIQIEGVFHTGEDALSFLKTHQVRLMFTDICMPGMNGLELIERAVKMDPDMRIVVLSAYDNFEYVRKAFLLGVKDYLLKPVDRIALAEILNHGNEDAPCTDDSDSRRIIEKVKRIIAERMGKTITLSSLAEAISLSPTYLSTLFKEATGENLFSYVTRVRIENAQRLLRDSNLKVYEIAEISGYSDTKYFSYVFKKQCGMTPLEYRESSGSSSAL